MLVKVAVDHCGRFLLWCVVVVGVLCEFVYVCLYVLCEGVDDGRGM